MVRISLIALLLAACTASPAPASSSLPPASSTSRTAPASALLTWRRLADIPTPRSEVAAAALRGTIFVVGGFGGGNVVETYAGDRWSAGAPYPLTVDHAMAAGIDALGTPGVYVFGGNVNGVATARSFRCCVEQRWQEIAPMPGPRAQGGAVAVDAKVYVVGGASMDRLVSPTYVYDSATDRWSTAAAVPTPRDHLGAAILGGRVCAVGGRRLSLLQNLATFECYDPSADSWQRMPDAPTARGGIGAAALGGRIFVVGGEQPLGTFKEVDIFDSVAGKWSRGPDLPTARHGLGVVAVGTTLFVMSGGPTPGGSQTAVCEALDVR